MKVVYRVEIGDEARRALRARQGRPGLATRYEICSLIDMMLDHDVSDALADLRATRARRATPKAERVPYGFRKVQADELAAKLASGEWPAGPEPKRKGRR